MNLYEPFRTSKSLFEPYRTFVSLLSFLSLLNLLSLLNILSLLEPLWAFLSYFESFVTFYSLLKPFLASLSLLWPFEPPFAFLGHEKPLLQNLTFFIISVRIEQFACFWRLSFVDFVTQDFESRISRNWKVFGMFQVSVLLFVTILKNAKEGWTISSCSRSRDPERSWGREECWNHPWCHLPSFLQVLFNFSVAIFGDYHPVRIANFWTSESLQGKIICDFEQFYSYFGKFKAIWSLSHFQNKLLRGMRPRQNVKE